MAGDYLGSIAASAAAVTTATLPSFIGANDLHNLHPFVDYLANNHSAHQFPVTFDDHYDADYANEDDTIPPNNANTSRHRSPHHRQHHRQHTPPHRHRKDPQKHPQQHRHPIQQYFMFNGLNLTMLHHQQRLLHEAVKHYLPSVDGDGNDIDGDESAFYDADAGSGLYGPLDDHPRCPSLEMPVGNAISMVLYALVFIVGLVGNTLVIYVVVRFSKMQTVTNMYLLNLAVADECFLIGIPFLIYTMQTGSWTLGKWACKAYMISTSVTQFTSSIFLFIMSADRYVAVCHPISATRFRSPFVSKMVSAGAWMASAVMMVPVFWFANTIEKHDGDGAGGGGGMLNGGLNSLDNAVGGGREGEEEEEEEVGRRMTCNIEWSHGYEGSGSTFTLYSFAVGFALPLTMILVFYYLVLRKLRTVGPKAKSKEKRRSHRKVTKLVLTVITVYVLCWLPYWISQVALISSSPEVCHSRVQVIMFLMVGCLGYSNSAMNPILYAFLSDNFKKSFMKACTCAAGKDINTQLQMENSLFPRFGRGGAGRAGSGRGRGGVKGGTLRGEVVVSEKDGGKCVQSGEGVGTEGGHNAVGTELRCVDEKEVGTKLKVGGTMEMTQRVEFGRNCGGAGNADGERVDGRYADISESAQTKSTNVSVYKSSSNSAGSSSGCSGERPPVLHTDF